jgi:hypothetical protein
VAFWTDEPLKPGKVGAQPGQRSTLFGFTSNYPPVYEDVRVQGNTPAAAGGAEAAPGNLKVDGEVPTPIAFEQAAPPSPALGSFGGPLGTVGAGGGLLRGGGGFGGGGFGFPFGGGFGGGGVGSGFPGAGAGAGAGTGNGTGTGNGISNAQQSQQQSPFPFTISIQNSAIAQQSQSQSQTQTQSQQQQQQQEQRRRHQRQVVPEPAAVVPALLGVPLLLLLALRRRTAAAIP